MQSTASVTEQSAVATAYKAYLHAWKDKDYAALDRLLSNDYKAVNFRGIVSTKANEIATAKEDRDYADMKGEVMSVTMFGNSAVGSGVILASWKDEQGKLQQMTFRFLAMLQKQKGEWRLVATQSTRLSKT
jgi:ketosteroid isomerase-like protein